MGRQRPEKGPERVDQAGSQEGRRKRNIELAAQAITQASAVGATRQNLLVTVQANSLGTAHQRRELADLFDHMPSLGKAAHRIFRESVFDQQLTVRERSPARGINGSLYVGAEINQVDQQLYVGLGLTIASWTPEKQAGPV